MQLKVDSTKHGITHFDLVNKLKFPKIVIGATAEYTHDANTLLKLENATQVEVKENQKITRDNEEIFTDSTVSRISIPFSVHYNPKSTKFEIGITKLFESKKEKSENFDLIAGISINSNKNIVNTGTVTLSVAVSKSNKFRQYFQVEVSYGGTLVTTGWLDQARATKTTDLKPAKKPEFTVDILNKR